MGKNRLERFSQFIYKYKYQTLIFILAATLVIGYGIRYLKFDVVLEEMFPENHSFVELHKKYSHIFGGTNTFLCEVRVKKGDIFNESFLKRIRDITDEIYFYEDVYPGLTASIALQKMKYMITRGEGEILIEPLMWPDIPRKEEGLEFLKSNIITSPRYYGTLVSKDLKSTLIIAELKEKIDYEKFYRFFSKLKATYEDNNTSIHMVGRPALLGYIYSYLPQVYKIFGITIIAIAVLLYLFWGNIVGFVIPIGVALLDVVWGLGFAGYLGINFSPLMIVLPFLVGARTIGHSVQIAHRYEEEHRMTMDRKTAFVNTLRSMFLPTAVAIATDTLGFASLLLSDFRILKNLSYVMMIWFSSVFVLGFIFRNLLSALLIQIPGKGEKKKQGITIWGKINKKLTNFATGKRTAKIITLLALLSIFSAFLSYRSLQAGDYFPGSPLLWPQSQYNRDYEEINKRFAGAGADTLLLFFEGNELSVESPAFLHYIDNFERFMAKKLPDVYRGAFSLTQIVKDLNMVFHEGDPAWVFIPDEEKMTQDLILLYRQRGDPADFDRFSDPLFKYGNTLLFFKDHTKHTIMRIKEVMEEFFKIYPPKVKNGEFKPMGGVIGIEAATNEKLTESLMWIDLLIIVSIFIVCALSFRSLLVGFILIIPPVISTSTVFTYMSFFKIGLTINSLPVCAVIVGVGIDFGIYLCGRYREELTYPDIKKGMLKAAETTSEGIVFSALSIIIPLFIWWTFADIKFQAQMGGMLIVAFMVNLFCALILTPALVSYLKPESLIRR